MKRFNLLIILLSLYIPITVHTQNSIKGKVIDEKDGEPLLGVNIIIEELKIGTATNLNGDFRFDNIQEGTYTIKFSYIGHKTILKKIIVPQSEPLIIKMVEGSVNLQEVVVTGNPLEIDPKNISQSTLTIANMDLNIKRSSTIGETLNFQPGISLRSNGTAASRPVIRGFSNNRILILENGLRMGDLSNTSDDHAVSDDGISVERIEVLRGPASLLYGSNAIGGVINVITEAIPTYIPSKPDATVNLVTSTVNKELAGNFDFHYGLNDFGFHGNYFNRTNRDYKDGNGNKVVNSDQFSRGYQFGISFIPHFGTAGLSYANYFNGYGIPLNPNENNGDGPIKIEMKKQELRILLESSKVESFVKSFSLKGGYQNYQHQEISRLTGETGTAFGLKSYSADLSFKHQKIFSALQGVFGFWGLQQNYSVTGAEAFTPNADYSSLAAYFFEEVKFNNLNLQFGARYEINKIKIPQAEISDSTFPSAEKKYYSLSGSIGLVYNLTDKISLFANLANAFRAPTIEELSSYAIHEATATFDIGDRNLVNEKNLGFDLGLRVRKANHLAELNFYYNNLDDYIFRKPTNLYYNVETSKNHFNTDGIGIPVYQYSQSGAVIYGTELKAQYEFNRFLSTTVIFDYVRGEQKILDENLPQLPPMRFSIEQRYSNDNYWFGILWKLAGEQNKTAPFETPTKGYGLIDIYAGIKLLMGNYVHMIDLKINNLLDQPYRDHLSAIKNFAYMPGRNIQLSYKFLF
ncbi:TonB-dependent receptor [Melioribacteraceae bacterium 4301-Me]|uniref:TonB-dependent receptor n=1 Tax=Pyranulibacter aquaticus TaxID=3163344 RepID=UPI003595BBFF